MNIFEYILNLIYPKVCFICERGVSNNDEQICFRCRSNLPKTKFTDATENDLLRRFHGRINVNYGLSYLYYYKSGITQKLLHQFKYKNHPEIGLLIGKWLGHELLKSNYCRNIDLIIPVPLHPKKERKRGYNQSQYFAKGIAEITKIPTEFRALSRIHPDDSQTQKSRIQRWKSVRHAFRVENRKAIEHKNILLVDDVITTGATLEACGIQLVCNGANGLGIATVAVAK